MNSSHLTIRLLAVASIGILATSCVVPSGQYYASDEDGEYVAEVTFAGGYALPPPRPHPYGAHAPAYAGPRPGYHDEHRDGPDRPDLYRAGGPHRSGHGSDGRSDRDDRNEQRDKSMDHPSSKSSSSHGGPPMMTHIAGHSGPPPMHPDSSGPQSNPRRSSDDDHHSHSSHKSSDKDDGHKESHKR